MPEGSESGARDPARAEPPVRIDKWLWAARFFKTRSLASAAVSGGKVQVGGTRVKPSRTLQIGERLSIHKNGLEWEITILGLSRQRGPAPIARTLYSESESSRARRQEEVMARRARGSGGPPAGAPDKHARQALRRLRGR